jgi:hypothetical protein
LQWEKIPEAQTYQFEISRSKQFKQIERRLEVQESGVELPPLPVGKYFWRVRAQNTYLGNWPPSPSFELQVRKRMRAPKPKAGKVLPTSRISNQKTRHGLVGAKARFFLGSTLFRGIAWAAAAEKNWLEFSWEAVPHARAYQLQVSERSDFKTTLLSTEGAKNSARVELPLLEKYYWRVAAIDEDGDLGKFSSPQVLLAGEKIEIASTPRSPTQVVAPQTPSTVASAPVEIPRDRYFRYWFGYGASYLFEEANGDTYFVRSTGLPLHRVVGGGSVDFAQTSLEWHAWVLPLSFHSEGSQPSFSRVHWGGDLFWSRLVFPKAFPLGLGFRARSETALTSVSASTLAMEVTPFSAILFGTGWEKVGTWPWRSSVWVEIAPWGKKLGAGLIWRNRFGLPFRLGGLDSSIEVLIHPYYRRTPAVASSEWNVEIAAAWVLEGVNVLSPPAATTR